MISKKLNKKRRLQAFAKLFDKNAFRFISTSRCLVGQMLKQAGITVDRHESVTDKHLSACDKFYGFRKGYSNELMFSASLTWGKLLGVDRYSIALSADTAERVIQALIKARS